MLLLFTAVVMAFYSHEPPGRGTTSSCSKIRATEGKRTLLADAAGKRTCTFLIKKGFVPEGVFIKTATRIVHSGRNEVVSFRDAFFLSLITYNPLTAIDAVQGFNWLHFEPQQQKIIFPYHHFW